MNITNHLNLPEAIVSAIRNDNYDGGSGDISVTRLIAPPQLVELERQHREEITEDASMRLWSLMGQAMHTVLERAHDSALKENRLYLKVLDWTISGQYDRLHVDSGVMQDYKFASVWEAIYGLKPEREAQLNVLGYLAKRNGHTINRLETVFLFRDWSKSKAKQSGDYPQTQIAIIPVSMWSEEKALGFIEQRVKLHQAARAGQIPPCTDDERWAKPTVHAVMKVGRKSAVKLCGTSAEAYKHAQDIGGYIVERPGEQTRCETYCAAAPFCAQFKALKGESE